MAIGLGLVAMGYVVIAIAVKGLGLGEKVSMWWLIGLYVIHTIGELCLSPIGLSMVSKLAPLRLSSLMMGTWFLANAAANKFAGTLSALIPGGEDGTGGATHFLGFQITNLYEFFVLFIIMSGTAAAILFFLSSWLEKECTMTMWKRNQNSYLNKIFYIFQTCNFIVTGFLILNYEE